MRRVGRQEGEDAGGDDAVEGAAEGEGKLGEGGAQRGAEVLFFFGGGGGLSSSPYSLSNESTNQGNARTLS